MLTSFPPRFCFLQPWRHCLPLVPLTPSPQVMLRVFLPRRAAHGSWWSSSTLTSLCSLRDAFWMFLRLSYLHQRFGYFGSRLCQVCRTKERQRLDCQVPRRRLEGGWGLSWRRSLGRLVLRWSSPVALCLWLPSNERLLQPSFASWPCCAMTLPLNSYFEDNVSFNYSSEC